ncbi:hypothetical protein ERJ75_000906500 [Trypanosoma vivax]|nr:hypothetical protein ERJ75_000906500 [Trypanosoma vivax]
MANQRMCSSVGTGTETAKSARTQGQEGRAEQQRTCHAKPSIFPAWQIKPDEQSQRSGLGEKGTRDGNDPTGAMLAGTGKAARRRRRAREAKAWTKNGRMVGEALLCSARWPRGGEWGSHEHDTDNGEGCMVALMPLVQSTASARIGRARSQAAHDAKHL